jgi:hypothetical protein
LRAWNPRGEPIQQTESEWAGEVRDPAAVVARYLRRSKEPSREAAALDQGAVLNQDAPPRKIDHARRVWSNPVLWREIRTRAYGTRPVLIKLGYFLVFLILLWSLYTAASSPTDPRLRFKLAWPIVPMCVLSLLLVNAQAVTAVTSERDLKSIDLLLCTDLSPREFVYGKLLGIFYNTKEMVLAPILALSLALGWQQLDPVAWLYCVVTLLVFFAFAAVLGIHAALRYDSSRAALANSLGTMFLLFVGMLICLYLILLSGGRFEAQWGSFILFIVLGSIGLWISLSANAPSNAISLTASIAPVATFYCLVGFIVGDRTAPFLVSTAVYSFAVASLLVPLLSEFDVATGRTTADE